MAFGALCLGSRGSKMSLSPDNFSVPKDGTYIPPFGTCVPACGIYIPFLGTEKISTEKHSLVSVFVSST